MPRNAAGKSYITIYLSSPTKEFIEEHILRAEVKRTGNPKDGTVSAVGIRALREFITVRLKNRLLRAQDIPDDATELADIKAKFGGDR
jgi:hypothetical protein